MNSSLWCVQYIRSRKGFKRRIQRHLKIFLRMDEICFNKFLEMLKLQIQRRDPNMHQSISVDEKLALTLRHHVKRRDRQVWLVKSEQHTFTHQMRVYQRAKKLVRIEATCCRVVHIHALEFANTNWSTRVCRVKTALRSFQLAFLRSTVHSCTPIPPLWYIKK